MQDEQRISDDIGFLFSRAGAIILNAAKKSLAPLGLNVRTYSVLALASEGTSGVKQRSAASALGIDPSQLVSFIDELEDRGLVTRTADPDDRRNNFVIATPQGRLLHADAFAATQQAYSSFLGATTDDELHGTREILKLIVFGTPAN